MLMVDEVSMFSSLLGVVMQVVKRIRFRFRPKARSGLTLCHSFSVGIGTVDLSYCVLRFFFSFRSFHSFADVTRSNSIISFPLLLFTLIR
jgi:hypothetical protein